VGNPAHFQQQPALNKELIRAQANDIQYILKNDALLLAGNATIFQQGSIISSDKINYNIAAESVAASSSYSETSRVKMVLEPSGADIPKNDDTQDIESALPVSIAKDKP
jgi:lipopolysaccharide export system protein LptA